MYNNINTVMILDHTVINSGSFNFVEVPAQNVFKKNIQPKY